MSITTRSAAFCAVAILCTGAVGFAQTPSTPERLTVPFSDPGRIGKVELDAFGGTISIRGTNRKDVQISARPRGDSDKRERGGEPPAGLRRLPKLSGFDIEESRNVVEISTSPMAGHDFEIEVPSRTNLAVSLVSGGQITIADVEGDIEVENVNGAITLNNIAGAVVADSVNGTVKANIIRLAQDKPMAFTTLNGVIDVTFPASIKATFKLRSDQGEIFTDFDLQMKAPASASAESRRGNEPLRIEVNRSLVGTANGGGPEIELRSLHGNIYLRKGK
jgi:hypothetical protein